MQLVLSLNSFIGRGNSVGDLSSGYGIDYEVIRQSSAAMELCFSQAIAYTVMPYSCFEVRSSGNLSTQYSLPQASVVRNVLLEGLGHSILSLWGPEAGGDWARWSVRRFFQGFHNWTLNPFHMMGVAGVLGGSQIFGVAFSNKRWSQWQDYGLVLQVLWVQR